MTNARTISQLRDMRDALEASVRCGGSWLGVRHDDFAALLDIADTAAHLVERRDGRLALILDVDALTVAVESLMGELPHA